MKEYAKLVGVSENYISEIERGVGHRPSDKILSAIAHVYGISEIDVFDAFNSIPVDLTDELRKNKDLLNTLYQIQNNEKLSSKMKQELYHEIVALYRKFIEDVDKKGD